MSQPISIDRAMPAPKSEHVHAMRDSAADADEVSWTEIPLGDEAMAVMVRPGMIFALVTRFASGTLIRYASSPPRLFA